jgi:hypothetical protein
MFYFETGAVIFPNQVMVVSPHFSVRKSSFIKNNSFISFLKSCSKLSGFTPVCAQMKVQKTASISLFHADRDHQHGCHCQPLNASFYSLFSLQAFPFQLFPGLGERFSPSAGIVPTGWDESRMEKKWTF